MSSIISRMLTYNCERTIIIFSIFQVGQFYDGDAYYVSVLHLQIWLLNWDGAFLFIVFLTFLICSDTCVGLPFSQFFPGAVIPLSCFLYPPFRSSGQGIPGILQFQFTICNMIFSCWIYNLPMGPLQSLAAKSEPTATTHHE